MFDNNETRFFVNDKTGEMECHTGGVSSKYKLFRKPWREVSGHYWNSSIPNLYYGILRILSGNLSFWMLPILLLYFPISIIVNFFDFLIFCAKNSDE